MRTLWTRLRQRSGLMLLCVRISLTHILRIDHAGCSYKAARTLESEAWRRSMLSSIQLTRHPERIDGILLREFGHRVVSILMLSEMKGTRFGQGASLTFAARTGMTAIPRWCNAPLRRTPTT